MEQIYKKIEAETRPGKKPTDSQKWLQGKSFVVLDSNSVYICLYMYMLV